MNWGDVSVVSSSYFITTLYLTSLMPLGGQRSTIVLLMATWSAANACSTSGQADCLPLR